MRQLLIKTLKNQIMKKKRMNQNIWNIWKLKYPQDDENGCIIILYDLDEKERVSFWVQSMFKRFGHIILRIFIISQECYELPKRTLWANGKTYNNFKPNNFRDVKIFYQDRTSIDITLNGFKLLTSTCWNQKYQPLTTDMTKDKYTGWFRLGLSSRFVPDRSP